MTAQVLTTPNGEEMIVLSRRDYDSLLARLGDEEAEDRMTVLIAREARAALDAGTEILLPGWFVEGMAIHRNPVRTVREHFGRTRATLAEESGLAESLIAEIEGGAEPATAQVLDAISKSLDLDPRILQRTYWEPGAEP